VSEVPEFANEGATNEVEHVEESEDGAHDVGVQRQYVGRSLTPFIYLAGGRRRRTLLRRRETPLMSVHCLENGIKFTVTEHKDQRETLKNTGFNLSQEFYFNILFYLFKQTISVCIK